MKKNVKLIISLSFYALVICAGILLVPRLFHRASKPTETRETVYEGIQLSAPLYTSAPGYSVSDNKHASLDYSNASQGYITARYKGSPGDGPVMKVNYGEIEYTYLLSGEDDLPLTCGDGSYTFKLYQKLSGGKYKAVLTKTITVELENQLLPYLYPSQLVDYSASSISVEYADQMCAGMESDLDKLAAVYSFLVDNITYDYQKAANVQAGYIPSVDSTYISRTGICFDYSVMMAAMLRTQLIPTKLVMGYLNGTSVFHAWNEVYLKDSGWVTVNIYVDMDVFRMLDSTLAASQSDEAISRKLDDPEVYMPVYRY